MRASAVGVVALSIVWEIRSPVTASRSTQGGAEGVARLVPVDEIDPLADLRARGLVRDPTAPRNRPARQARLKAAKPVSDLVADQRR
jgi:hypothetical protein